MFSTPTGRANPSILLFDRNGRGVNLPIGFEANRDGHDTFLRVFDVNEKGHPLPTRNPTSLM